MTPQNVAYADAKPFQGLASFRLVSKIRNHTLIETEKHFDSSSSLGIDRQCILIFR